jgi:protein-S-isoprenylcysteine O-methyltransferase Ste14
MTTRGSRWVRWRVRLGYPLAAFCLWLAHPSWTSVALGTAIASVGLLVRAAAAGYLHKGQTLATSGPYARTRNPLYFGSAFLAAGFGAASRSWLAAVLLLAFFWATYYAVMRREEGELHSRFGQSFEEYASRVPLFWPRLGTAGQSGDAEFSFAQYLRNREYRAAIGVLLLMAVFAAMAVWRK